MRKALYLAIIERLKAANLGIQHYSLWNNNIESLSTEQGYQFPAVFIEFEPIQWAQEQQRVRTAQIRVRLHIVTDTLGSPADGSQYQQEGLAHLDLLEQIDAAVQGLCGENFNGFMLVESVPDTDHENVLHNEECFVTQVCDQTAVKQTVRQVTGVGMSTTIDNA